MMLPALMPLQPVAIVPVPWKLLDIQLSIRKRLKKVGMKRKECGEQE